MIEPTEGQVIHALKKVRTRGLRDAVARGHAGPLITFARHASDRPLDENLSDEDAIQLVAAMLNEEITHFEERHRDALIDLLELELQKGRVLDITARRTKAAAKVGLSPSSFERWVERPKLKDLGELLFSRYGITTNEQVEATNSPPPDEDKVNVRPLVPKMHEAAISALSLLVGDAVRLAELCEMYLATRTLDAALQEAEDQTRLRRHRPALIKPMWKAYRDLLLSGAYCFGDADSPASQQIARYLPQDILVAVESALTQINAPVGIDTAERRLIFDVYTQGIDTRDIRTYRKQFHDVYSGWWWDFAEGEAYHYPDDFDTSLKTILNTCRELRKHLRNYVQDYLVAGGTAKEQALSAAANYYGEDLNLKMLDLGTGRRSDGTLRQLLAFARPEYDSEIDDDEAFSLSQWIKEHRPKP